MWACAACAGRCTGSLSQPWRCGTRHRRRTRASTGACVARSARTCWRALFGRRSCPTCTGWRSRRVRSSQTSIRTSRRSKPLPTASSSQSCTCATQLRHQQHHQQHHQHPPCWPCERPKCDLQMVQLSFSFLLFIGQLTAWIARYSTQALRLCCKRIALRFPFVVLSCSPSSFNRPTHALVSSTSLSNLPKIRQHTVKVPQLPQPLVHSSHLSVSLCLWCPSVSLSVCLSVSLSVPCPPLALNACVTARGWVVENGIQQPRRSRRPRARCHGFHIFG